MSELSKYKQYVEERLGALTPFLQNYALGDFTEELHVPEEEDEFTELLVGINLMVEDFREMLRELVLKNVVFEASITAQSIADNEGIITHVNPSFLKLWGYESTEAAIGNSVGSFFVNQEDAVPVLTALNQIGIWEGEFFAKRIDGSTFTSRGYATVVRNEQGEQIGYQSANIDITEEKEAKEKLEKALKELKKTNDAMERFNRMAVGREQRMIELKREVNQLADELGRDNPYDLSFAEEV
jgi:PAS domain S-box-containing protein